MLIRVERWWVARRHKAHLPRTMVVLRLLVALLRLLTTRGLGPLLSSIKVITVVERTLTKMMEMERSLRRSI
jgi:hypothetical protein